MVSSFSTRDPKKKEADLPASFCVAESALDTEAGFGFFDKLRKRGLVHHRDIPEHLAVDRDGVLLEPVHEHTVRQAVLAHGGVDPRDPQAAEVALLVAAIAIGILPGAHARFVGDAEHVVAAAAETLGARDDFLVGGACGDATFNSWHGSSPYA